MKKFILNFIKALMTFIAILIYSKIIFKESSYNILLSILFFLILIFYYKFDMKKIDKKAKNYSLVLSVLISIIMSLGSIVSSYVFEPAVNIFDLKNAGYFLISSIGLSLLFYHIFAIIFKKFTNMKITEDHNKMTKKQFFLIVLFICLGYSFYFVRFYPAIMTPDSYYVIHYANNYILSDFHPFGHTWFFGIFFHFGKLIFNNLNACVAFSIIVQMISMATIFSIVIRFLYNNGLKKNTCLFLVLLYTINPLHAHYSITLWRDVMFGGSFILILIALYNFIKEKQIKKSDIILFIVGTLILLFFRNNGIYIYLFIIPFMIIAFKEHRLVISVLTISLASFYFIIKGPVFNYFNIEKTTSVEAFSIPLQQMARVISSDREIPETDRKYLEQLFEYELVSSKYNNVISDPIKNITDNKFLTNNKIDFFRTYLNLLVKYPNVYVEAYFLQTLGYWYPDEIYWATAGESSQMFLTENVYSKPLTKKLYNKIIDMTTSRKLPLNNLIWSIGLHFILLVISSFILSYIGNKKYLICYIPLYGLWISIMMSTPVFCELRYVYGLFTCAPLVILIPFITINEKSK